MISVKYQLVLRWNKTIPILFGVPLGAGKIAATTIRYQLPKATQVVLKIYNTFGQETGQCATACRCERGGVEWKG